MKTLYCTFIGLQLATYATAQNFTLGSTDLSSNATQPLSPDAKTVSYAYNTGMDS